MAEDIAARLAAIEAAYEEARNRIDAQQAKHGREKFKLFMLPLKLDDIGDLLLWVRQWAVLLTLDNKALSEHRACKALGFGEGAEAEKRLRLEQDQLLILCAWHHGSLALVGMDAALKAYGTSEFRDIPAAFREAAQRGKALVEGKSHD